MHFRYILISLVLLLVTGCSLYSTKSSYNAIDVVDKDFVSTYRTTSKSTKLTVAFSNPLYSNPNAQGLTINKTGTTDPITIPDTQGKTSVTISGSGTITSNSSQSSSSPSPNQGASTQTQPKTPTITITSDNHPDQEKYLYFHPNAFFDDSYDLSINQVGQLQSEKATSTQQLSTITSSLIAIAEKLPLIAGAGRACKSDLSNLKSFTYTIDLMGVDDSGNLSATDQANINSIAGCDVVINVKGYNKKVRSSDIDNCTIGTKLTTDQKKDADCVLKTNTDFKGFIVYDPSPLSLLRPPLFNS